MTIFVGARRHSTVVLVYITREAKQSTVFDFCPKYYGSKCSLLLLPAPRVPIDNCGPSKLILLFLYTSACPIISLDSHYWRFTQALLTLVIA